MSGSRLSVDPLAEMPLGRPKRTMGSFRVPNSGHNCAECGVEISWKDWLARDAKVHSNEHGEDVHEACCNICSVHAPEEETMTTIIYDDPFADSEVTEEPYDPPVEIATEKQKSYISSLIREREVPENLATSITRQLDSNTLAKREATAYIGQLKTLPKRAGFSSAEPPEGIHRTSEGEIYKVQVAHHGSGNLYAKRLVILQTSEQPTGSWNTSAEAETSTSSAPTRS